MTYEVWLSGEYGYFDRGVAHLDDGQTLPLKAWIHQATYGSDGVLIDDAEHFDCGRFPLRWLVEKDGLFFYSVDEDTPDVIFHNETDNFLLFGSYGALLPHASRRIILYPPKDGRKKENDNEQEGKI